MPQNGIGPDNMNPNGISFDIANSKYRQFKSCGNILEYTLGIGEITIDWVQRQEGFFDDEINLGSGGYGSFSDFWLYH